jgi:phosphonoacetaldehyde hydrolase
VISLSSVLVVDDTPIGIVAGVNTGGTTVAVTQTGNALGLTEAEIAELPPGELEQRLAVIDQQFREAGADHLVRTVAELPELLDRLESN